MIEPQRLSEIIGAIYDCSIDPDRWQPTLTAIMEELGFANAALSIHDGITLEAKIHVDVNVPLPAGLEKYTAAVLDLWGGQARIAAFPLEEPIIQSEATSPSTWHGNLWFEDFCKPRQLLDCVMLILARNSSTYAILAFGHYGDGEITVRAREGLRLVAPHLRRAVVIGRLLEQEMARSFAFSDVLDGVSAGVVLVDQDLGIVHANHAARAMLEAGDPIQSFSGKLATANPFTTSVLAEAAANAASNESGIGRRSIDLPAQRRDGTHTIVQVLPIKRRTFAGGLAQRAVAAVFVANAAAPPAMPADALSLMYELTPAETRVFELVVSGRSRDEIGYELGITLATVKTHLARVFEKTGCRRQADLVAIANRAALVL